MITEYLNAPVAVSISNVQNATLELPDLVICPIRGINASRLVEDGMPLYLVDLIMSDYGVDIDWKSLDGLSSNLSKKESSKNEFNQWLSSHNLDDYKDLLLNYSYNPDEFIHQIYFSDEDLNHVNLNDSKLIVGYTNGVCSVYVTQQTVFWPGLAGGYQLTLKMSQRNIYDNSFTDGWQIGLSKPFEVAPSNYLRIPTNSAVDIEISRIEIHRFPSYIWPKSGILCKDSPDYKASDNCAGLAYSQAIKALCNCTYIRTPKDLKNRKSGDRVCNPIELNICFFNIYPMVKKETSRLQAECLPVCNEINFQSTMTHGEINREAILSKLNLPDTTVS